MRITNKNLQFALFHPLKALRYLYWRDSIPYQKIAKYLPEDPVIVEAGAADGSNTLEMANFWPKGKIIAFEPVPSARNVLKDKVSSRRDRVSIYPYALGNSKGKFSMWVSGDGESGTQSSSLLEPQDHQLEYDFVKFQSKIEVETVDLDSFIVEQGLGRVDFLWLDLQGFELIALRGAVGLLQKVKAIHSEVHLRPLYKGAPSKTEVCQFLKDHGFHPAIDATFRVGGNVLFVRKS